MIAPRILAELRKLIPGHVRENESLRSRTTFRCSASSAAMAMPQRREELVAVIGLLASNGLAWGKDWQVIGCGSNLLIRDGGYPGVLIDLSEGFFRTEILEDGEKEVRVRAEAGVPNGILLEWARERNLSRLGWVFGIPGSVGGGIRMNAGTPLGGYGRITKHVEGVDTAGRAVGIAVTPDDFPYRDFPLGRNLVITAGHLTLERAEPEKVVAEIEAAKEKRKNQPAGLPNFGSVFKNPPGDFAARLIEAAGLKGLRIGDAEISRQHSNFIVNLGSAKTSDVWALMSEVQKAVKKRFNVTLEPEVHLIGVEK